MNTSDSSTSGKVPILELDGISVSTGCDAFSLKIFPGELVLFECARNHPIPDLWDIFVGLVEPMEGCLKFEGMTWNEMSETLIETNRLSVGCVFTGGGKYESQWLDNLDIDENVVLAQSMNANTPESEMIAHLGRLLEHFAIKELPGKRPMKVSLMESMQAQWIRAFLPQPLKLLILERPTYSVSSSEVGKFVDQVSKVREEGTAVLWIDVAKSESERKALAPTKHFDPLPPGLE